MKFFSRAIVTICMLASVNSFAEQAMNCSTVSTKFKISSIETLEGTSLQNEKDGNMTGGVFLDLPIQERIITGKIRVLKKCTNENKLLMKEIFIPASASLKMKGLNLRAGTLGYFRMNGEMTFNNTSGLTLRELLDSKYYGGKLAASLAFIIGLNPNLNVMISKDGAFIADSEGMFAFGPTAAIGGVLSEADIEFFADYERVKVEDKVYLDAEL